MGMKSKDMRCVLILMAAALGIYLAASIYFLDHFFFHTAINGVDVSLRAHDDVESILRKHISDYKLQVIERDGSAEYITGKEIEMDYNELNSIHKIQRIQRPLMWIGSLLRGQRYYAGDLFIYSHDCLENKIGALHCLNRTVVEPENVSFRYINGTYEPIKEIYGNRINRDKLDKAVRTCILEGKMKLDLDESYCYDSPEYTLNHGKTAETKGLLNKYVSTKVTYVFRGEKEMLEGSVINGWLSVDEDLEVVVNKEAVMRYVRGLGKKYDTVGIPRKFRTTLGKIIEVKGGLYGWKINVEDETKALLENIRHGEVTEREPIYAQKALSMAGNEIGRTYVEINVTRQHLWFYKDGRMIAQGAVVTGNPNRGHSTKLGVYMLNYKQEGATLIGADYEAEVNYWMPFFGNIGIHDATWRHAFGGEIYKRRGSHGCVNAPLYLAERIYKNIEEGTPIICYEE